MEESFRRRGARLSNWGRWGADDEIGTLNFVTDECRRIAASLVRRGVGFELSIELGVDGPQSTHPRRFNPVHHMLVTPGDADPSREDGLISADDMLTMPMQSATQWDGLAHIGYDLRFYNDVPAAAVNNLEGASRNAIDKIANRLVSRGVLLDIARLRGVDSMEPGDEITAADLDEAGRRQGVEVGSGDILLIRTGWFRRYLAGEREVYTGDSEPGLGISCCDWLHAREVAATATDNWAFEVLPSTEPPAFLPVHSVLIRDMGMTLGEMFQLEELAADCEADGVWEFLLAASPLKVKAGTGSPVTPVAIK